VNVVVGKSRRVFMIFACGCPLFVGFPTLSDFCAGFLPGFHDPNSFAPGNQLAVDDLYVVVVISRRELFIFT